MAVVEQQFPIVSMDKTLEQEEFSPGEMDTRAVWLTADLSQADPAQDDEQEDEDKGHFESEYMDEENHEYDDDVVDGEMED